METGVHVDRTPFGSREPAAFTSMHPPKSDEMFNHDSDSDPTPVASLQPRRLDETVVAEEEQGGGQTKLLGHGISSGKTETMAIPETDASYVTVPEGYAVSAISSQYHSPQDIPVAILVPSSTPETSSFHTAGSLGTSYGTVEDEEEQHNFSVEIPREGDILSDIRGGGGDDATPLAREPRQRYVPDQPKLLLHEPPVAPRPEKEPLPPSPTSSEEAEDETIVPGQPRTHAQGQSPRGEPSDTTPLLPRDDPQPHFETSYCNCCTLL